jgi:hypothetical protein
MSIITTTADGNCTHTFYVGPTEINIMSYINPLSDEGHFIIKWQVSTHLHILPPNVHDGCGWNLILKVLTKSC